MINVPSMYPRKLQSATILLSGTIPIVLHSSEHITATTSFPSWHHLSPTALPFILYTLFSGLPNYGHVTKAGQIIRPQLASVLSWRIAGEEGGGGRGEGGGGHCSDQNIYRNFDIPL